MKLKVIVSSVLIFFILGFIVGRISTQQSPKITQTQVTEQKVLTTSDTTQTKNVQNNISKASQKIVSQKQFYPSGKIKQETETQIVYDYLNLGRTDDTQKNSEQIVDSKDSKTTLIENPEKNWMIGGLIPAENYHSYSDYSLQVSYRIYGQIWASAQSDLSFSRPMLGVQVSF